MKKFLRALFKSKQDKRLSQISEVFVSLGKLESSGLLGWDEKRRSLFVAEPLATVMLSRGAQGWANFLNNIFLYESYRYISDKVNDKIEVESAKEIAKAKKLTPSLTSFEERRIRMEVAEKVTDESAPMQKLDAFEFFIIPDDRSAPPVQCGIYDPVSDRFDIADWEEVARAVSPYP